MTTLRLIADDLTGALDTAAEFVCLVGPVDAFWHGVAPPVLPANAALDSGTRELDPGAAARVIAAMTPALNCATVAFKKVDSLMRGPTLPEIAACMRVGLRRLAVMAPAFPYQGRATRAGIQYARGLDGRWSAVGGDIVAQLRNLGVQAWPGRFGIPLPPGVSVFDANSDADLDRVAALGQAAGPVLWIGTGGLAQALARSDPAPAAQHLPRPVLGLFGSDHAVTAGQLEACGPDWVRLQDGGPDDLERIGMRLRTAGSVLASLDLPVGLDRDNAACRIRTVLHRLVCGLPQPGTLLVAGGETLRSLCRSLGAHSLSIRGRLVPGLPHSVLRGGLWDGVSVVSKSGAFGPPTLLRRLLDGAPLDAERTS